MNYENPFNQQTSEQQIIQKIKSEIVSIVNNEILKLKQELKSEPKESETTTTKKKPYTIFSSEDMVIKNYNNNIGPLNYTIEAPKPEEEDPNVDPNQTNSSIYAQVKFISPQLHILGLKNAKFYWIPTELC
jgi:hypothetical protein